MGHRRVEDMLGCDNVDDNDRACLLNDILHIHFAHLTDLKLWKNHIESVEGLSSVQMPHLQILQLGTSPIT